MNKQLELPVLIQRLAVISSATAAGYDDFMDQLKQNPYGLVFYTHLFPAIMQGDQAEGSIINALDSIYANADVFDAVILIRGGGAVADLACFDSYDLALNCAQFPLPILAGIGHQRDQSIVDLVVHSSLKTPTAVAEHLIQRLSRALDESNETFNSIIKILVQRTVYEKQKLNSYQWKLKQVLNTKLSARTIELERQKSRLRSAVHKNIATQKNKLLLLEKNIQVHSPSFMLKQGYTLTTLNGKKLTSIKALKSGNTLRTYLNDGSVESIII
jgi:exodeoxyribonuclease VII large subunit